MNYIERLQEAIKKMHGCESRHLESVPIEERFQGRVVWSGIVEVFTLTGHAKADRCYAWSAMRGDMEDFTAVLHLPPIISPRQAVQAAIASQLKSNR